MVQTVDQYMLCHRRVPNHIISKRTKDPKDKKLIKVHFTQKKKLLENIEKNKIY